MVLKPIKDDKIDKIVNDSKDYEMKLTSEQVLKEFEARKAKQIQTVNETKKEPEKKKKLFPYLGMGLASLATCAVVISVVYATKGPNIEVTNISSNVNLLKEEGASKSIGKELLLFNFNYDSNNDVATRALQNAYKINYANSDFIDAIDNIINRIALGFEKVSQIFLNGIFDFNDMKPEYKTLSKPKVINGEEFDSVITYRYALIVDFKYYYNSDGSLNYGYTEIDKGLFEGKDYYKTEINVVKKGDETFIETTLNKGDCYFKINNKGTKKATDSIFSYFTYLNQKDYEDEATYNQYFVNLDSNGNNSSFSLQNKNEYKIDYSNISNSLINLITCSFNVDYFDLIKDVKESFLNVKLSSVGDKSHYEIGGIVIEI